MTTSKPKPRILPDPCAHPLGSVVVLSWYVGVASVAPAVEACTDCAATRQYSRKGQPGEWSGAHEPDNAFTSIGSFKL